MRFLEKEKVLIILLHSQDVNLNKISRIINSIRSGVARDELLVKLKITDPKVVKTIRNFSYTFDDSRDKPCGRTAVMKVITKWIEESSIENKKRVNYSTKLSANRIAYLCRFVKRSNANRELSLSQLRDQLEMYTVTRATICNYLIENDLPCVVAKPEIPLNPDHISARMAFVNNYIDKPISYWEHVVFTDEKLIQNFSNGRTLIR